MKNENSLVIFAHTIDIKKYTHTFEGEKSQSSSIIKHKLDTPPPPPNLMFRNLRLKESGKYQFKTKKMQIALYQSIVDLHQIYYPIFAIYFKLKT